MIGCLKRLDQFMLTEVTLNKDDNYGINLK